MIPRVLDFRITSKCNMCCGFCFGPVVESSWELSLLKNFLVFLKNHGLKYVVLTGGEPTLSPDFVHVIKLLKTLEFQITLSTNGTFWNNEELRTIILENCSCIALPIESSIESVHNSMRPFGENHYALVNAILPQIRNMAPHFKIKIGTVVTRNNYSSVSAILNKLSIFPDTWKLFQLSQSKNNLEFYMKQRISDDSFNQLVWLVKQRYENVPTRIHASCEREREGRYLFLEPNGDIMTIKDADEFIFGNYKKLPEDMIMQIEKYVNAYDTNLNFSKSFGVEYENI